MPSKASTASHVTSAADRSAAPCPCGKPAALSACCGRWHEGAQRGRAPDAEALMRSRYSAYVLGLSAYLLETWHPRTRPATIDADPPGLRWLGLEVRAVRVLDDDHAEVEFVARCKAGGRAQRLHERSHFERIEGRWFYLEGDTMTAMR